MDRQYEILRAIALTGRYLSDVRNLSERLPAVLAQLGRAVQAEWVYIYENGRSPDGRFLASHRFTWSVFLQKIRRNIPGLQNLDYQAAGFQRWADALQSGQPIYGDIDTFPESEQAFLRPWGLRSLVIIPITYGGRWWGFLGLDNLTRQRAWSPGEIETLVYVGQMIGAAFENAYLLRAEAERRREAEILNQVSNYLTQSLEPEAAFAPAVQALRNHLGGDLFITLTKLDEMGEALVVLARTSTQRTSLERVGDRVVLAETVAVRKVVEEKRPFAEAAVTLEKFPNERSYAAIQSGLCSFLYLPLILQGRVVGALHIDVFTEPRQFSAAEITFCESVANLMAAAIEQQRLLEFERQQLRLARVLQQVGALLTAQLTLDQVYEQIFDLLDQVVAYDSVSIQLLDETKEHLYMVAGRGFPDEFGVKRFIHAIAQHCLNKFPPDNYITVSPDTYADPRWIRGAAVEYIRSWVGALLRVKGEVIGILNVDSGQVNAFNQQTAHTVGAFANQAAIAIENARLHEKALQNANELAILNEVALATAATVEIDDLLRQTTRTLGSRLYSESFGFVMVDEVAGVAWPHPSYHGVPPDLLHEPIPLSRSIVGKSVEAGRAIVVPDGSPEELCWLYNEGFHSAVAVPLKVDNAVIGVMVAESAERNAFSDEDIRFLTTLAGFVGLAIARTRLYRQLREQSDNLAEEVRTRTAELQSERDRTITILESAGESILLTDSEYNILYANRAAELQSGYSQTELSGQSSHMLESGLTPRSTYEEMWQTLAKGGQWSGELVNRRKDGSLYDVSLTISPIFNAQREIINYVTIQADITRLKEVDRLKTKFVTNVSHELRTPLTNIKTYVTLLERGRDENRARYLKILHHETDRLTQLIQDLLDLSRLDTEPMPNPDAMTDLKQSILEYLDVFAARAEVRQIAVNLDLPSEPLWVRVEGRHVGQLLTNLLGNALTYTSPGGHVWIKAALAPPAAQPQVRLQITDDGMGIASADLAHLFDRFYRGEQAQLSGSPGTGLGLAICYEIVKRYHGHITVESEVGVGSTFSVWLPVSQASETSEGSLWLFD